MTLWRRTDLFRIEGMEPQDVIEFAVAASCLNQSIEFDMNQVSVAEVNVLHEGQCNRQSAAVILAGKKLIFKGSIWTISKNNQ